MIEIHKIADINKIKSIIDLENSGSDDLTYVGVFDDENIVDFAGYVLNGDKMLIKYFSYNSNDFLLAEALMKTLIFYADLAGKRYLELEIEFEKIAKAFKFIYVDEKYVFDIFSQNTKGCVNC